MILLFVMNVFQTNILQEGINKLRDSKEIKNFINQQDLNSTECEI